MVISPDTKLKIRKFFKKYGKLLGIIAIVWLSIIAINNLIKINSQIKEPTTTYEPHKAVMDSEKEAPKKVKNSMEEFVEKYINYCNNEQYTDAYNMLSDECKEYFDTFSSFAKYVSNKFDRKKIYTIQNYSNYEGKYIYNVKLYDDVLASGLTNSVYTYQEEKITASYDENNNIVFSVGNYIGVEKINSVQENDYIKIDVVSKDIKYGSEVYEVKITNRSENIIVVKNNQIDDEILLKLTGEYRDTMYEGNIILEPGESKTYNFLFEKFYDDKKNPESLIFNSIRVVEQYIEENSNEENAIYKFSMEIGL